MLNEGINPADRYASRRASLTTAARERVLSVQHLFVAEGVLPEVVERVAEKAGAEASELFDDRLAQNPLVILRRVIEQSAITPEEKHLASEGNRYIDTYLSEWRETLDHLKSSDAYLRGKLNIWDRINQMLRQNSLSSSIELAGRYYPAVNILDQFMIRDPQLPLSRQFNRAMADAYAGRLLQGLGVLNPVEDLQSLQTVPLRRAVSESGATRRDMGSGGFEVKPLQTIIPGGDLCYTAYPFGESPYLTVFFDEDAFNRTMDSDNL